MSEQLATLEKSNREYVKKNDNQVRRAWEMYTQGTHYTEKKGEMPKKNLCQGKHREFGNVAKTQGIWFAQVVNSQILKVKDISKFAAKISNFFFKFEKSAKSVLCM